MTWVWRNGKIVKKSSVPPLARSDLMKSPYVVRDGMDPIKGMHNGKMYDSKSKLRKSYKRHGMVEVGNEMPAPRWSRKAISKNDVGEALRKVKAGYKPTVADTVIPED